MQKSTGAPQRLLLSAVIALLFLLITFWVVNWRISVGAEKAALQQYEVLKQWVFGYQKENTMSDSILQVDVHYDKQIVMEHNAEDAHLIRGKVAVTDRDKLLRLLLYLKKTNNYRYILLDVFFDPTVTQPSDSALFSLVSSMPRIVIPEPQNPQKDSCLRAKMGFARYGTTVWEGDFVKYHYLIDDKRSLALKMYEELTGNKISSFESLHFDGWRPVRSSAILTYGLVEDESLRDEHLYLGTSLVGDSIDSYEYQSLIQNPDFAKDRYVLIGDFEDDVHNTFMGKMSGCIINFNAFLFLQNGHHRISFWMMLLLFLSFWWLVNLTLSHSEFAGMFMWFGYPFYLLIICLFTYEIFHEVFDLLAATILLYALQNIIQCLRNKDGIVRWKDIIILKMEKIWKKVALLRSRF